MKVLSRWCMILPALALALVLMAVACGGDGTPDGGLADADVARIAQEAAAAAVAAAPKGLSEQDVTRIASEAAQAAAGQGLTTDDAARIAREAAMAAAAPPVDTQAIVSDAVAQALAQVPEPPPGLTAQDMAAAINEAIGQIPPGVTAEEVAMIANNAATQAASGGVSTEEVQAAIAMALAEALKEPEPFRIGAMDSLTGPGETYGNPILRAKQLAVDEINALGGINGRKLELIPEDSKCGATDAITAYKKLTEVDGVKIILGTTCSGAMLGAAPLAEADGVVLLSASATNPDIAQSGDYIFRTAINDVKLGVDTGNLLWADGVRKLATITEATDYAEGARRTSVEQFEKRGGEVVASESYASDVIDFKSQLTKLFSENPDALHLAAQTEAAGGTIIKQAREVGFEGPIYTESVPTGPTSLEIAGEAATGMKAIIPELDPNNTVAERFLENYSSRHGSVPLAWFLGSGYDDVYIAAECLRRTGDDQDADGVRDCLYNITWTGTIGINYSFDSDGEVKDLANAVVEILPVAERTGQNRGYKVLGPAPLE